MTRPEPFVDIHCHLIPGMDDGSQSWEQSRAMAEMAQTDGVSTIVVTPHQLGNFTHNSGQTIRAKTAELQRLLDQHTIPLQVLPGADVRIEDSMLDRLHSKDVLTLADQGRHVLLELPHELYFPLEPVLKQLHRAGMVGILSHPERNQGLLKQPGLIPQLIAAGCLMQVTCGSLMGTFGSPSQKMAEQMLEQGWVHFLATDAHSPHARRPLMHRAWERAAKRVGTEVANRLCCQNPARIVAGQDVPADTYRNKSSLFRGGWFRRPKAA